MSTVRSAVAGGDQTSGRDRPAGGDQLSGRDRPAGGDQPAVAPGRTRLREALVEQRDFLLGSISDLQAELAAGDLDHDAFAALRDDYVARAAGVLRQLEAFDQPAPALATETATPLAAAACAPATDRRPTRKVAVIGLVLLVAAGAVLWALRGASTHRAPGQVISGQAVGGEVTAQLLTDAQQATGKGDAVRALKDYRQILSSQPDQVDALTQEGWLLAQTQQPSLLSQGLDLLARAEKVDPSYTPAHVYRGIALLSEGDNAGAIPELQYYLAHGPDPSLVPQVRQALSRAQAAAAGGAG